MEQARIDMKNAMFSMSVWNKFNPVVVDKLQDPKIKQRFSIEEIIRRSKVLTKSPSKRSSIERDEDVQS